MPPPPRAKYAPLTTFLRALPPAVDRVALTFAEIEAIIDAPLPRTASTTGRTWWSNSPAVSYARIWRSVGWRVADLRRGPGGPRERIVTFARRAPAATASPPPPGARSWR